MLKSQRFPRAIIAWVRASDDDIFARVQERKKADSNVDQTADNAYFCLVKTTGRERRNAAIETADPISDIVN
jgi:hypothetical protein